ncbi:hypothetical protein LPB140_01540 [Sphingorhabdus lutea]|uniref:HAD family hydrolase n=1 Tax=Sphingorhabdus lutea TaxID=1913578 RepID=A0A1L3J9C2_9SPHN|nr:hypothetical protein [Sphingorhabdus lutea]APG61729.1 hypothetical protein LPB140_01540 [Sphingorhabdus lutea]
MLNPSGRPLLISDCDEVILHMVAPFAAWLDKEYDIIFDMQGSDFANALKYKNGNIPLEPQQIWEKLDGFFDGQMHSQMPISGAIEAFGNMAEFCDIVILTNLKDHRATSRAEQLANFGLHHPVYTNQGGKGAALARIIDEYKPSSAVFIDDLPQHHESVAKEIDGIWRLHFVGEPMLAPHVKAADHAHERIDIWAEAEKWVTAKLQENIPAPQINFAIE